MMILEQGIKFSFNAWGSIDLSFSVCHFFLLCEEEVDVSASLICRVAFCEKEQSKHQQSFLLFKKKKGNELNSKFGICIYSVLDIVWDLKTFSTVLDSL